MSAPPIPTLHLLAVFTLLAVAGCPRNEPATLVIAFQPQEDTARLAPNAAALAHFIGEKTGLRTKVFLPADYVAVVEALRRRWPCANVSPHGPADPLEPRTAERNERAREVA